MERRLKTEVIRNVSTGSTAWATGATGVRYVIPRTDRRLARATLHLNVTLAGTPGAAAVATDRIQGILSQAKFEASDLGRTSRNVVIGNSAELLAWDRLMSPGQSRYQRTQLGASANATYDLFIPMHFVHPSARFPVAYYQSIPFWTRNNDGIGLGEDPSFTFDLASINDRSLGLATDLTITHNHQRLILDWYEIDQADPLGRYYVPRELSFGTVDTGGAGGTGQKMSFPKDGFIDSILLQPFSTYSTGVRGGVLTNADTGYYDWIYRNVVIDTMYPKLAIHRQERYALGEATDVAPGATHNLDDDFLLQDFWKPEPFGEVSTLNTVPNVSTENRGDTLFLAPNDVTASKTIRHLTSKFLVNNPNALTGA